MLDKIYKNENHVRMLRGGPFGEHLDKYAARLVERGYSNVKHKFNVVIAFDRWVESRGLSLVDLSQDKADEFTAFRRRTKPSSEMSNEQTTIDSFLSLLREQRAIPPAPPKKKSAIDLVTEPYHAYLTTECGFVPKTVLSYWYCVRIFLRWLPPEKVECLNDISSLDVANFLAPFAKKYCGDRSQLMITSLKSFFRYLKFKGRMDQDLATYVPSVQNYRNAGLPIALDDSELARLIGACSSNGPMGKRDFAILKLLSLTGCRAIEVVRLTLDDIDWGRSEITIRGKCRRIDKLPLMHDVGAALADYIEHGRPKSNERRVFLSSRAPFRPISGSGNVSAIVRFYIERAGLNPKRKGAHLLRHTIATRALRQGATLPEIGVMLRQELIDTTAIYAKVDFQRLGSLTQSWPAGSAK